MPLQIKNKAPLSSGKSFSSFFAIFLQSGKEIIVPLCKHRGSGGGVN